MMEAKEFANEWINAWNAHDLDRIMDHYSEDIVFTSPFIQKVLGITDGTLRDKASLKNYFSKGLSLIPDLKFTLEQVVVGVNSMAIVYKNTSGILSVEVVELNDQGKIVRSLAHYAQ